ncbi:MAG: hypothetical protein RLZZ165_1730 [Bacteroidota bacterium]
MEATRKRRRRGPEHPYPGLRPYYSHENLIFFGRDGQIDTLINRMRDSKFLAVLGGSGSGKSSLVRAGLLPALDAGRMSGASDWKIAIMRPGDRPIHFLAEELANLIKAPNDPSYQMIEPMAMLKTMLASSCFGLEEAAMGPILEQGQNLLIVVDQFEEIFRFADEMGNKGQEDEARAFIRLLIEATSKPENPIYIIITMRSDFLGECPRFVDLPEAINRGQYLIPRLSRQEMRETITRPGAVFHGQFAPELVVRLLNDVGDNPDQLPILQHALMRTWNIHKEGEEVQITDYSAIGGLGNALNQHAEEIYASLEMKGLAPVTEMLFKCLTKMESDGRGIRRPTRLKDICAVRDMPELQVIEVIEAYRAKGCSFLMPPEGVPLTPDSVIDISHESFMRLWKRLGDWLREESRAAEQYILLSRATALYLQGKANLWRQPELGIALKWQEETKPTEAWASRYEGNYEASMKFLSDSHAAWIKEEEEKAAVLLLQQKSESQRKNLRRLVVVICVIIGLLVFSVFATIYALDQKGIAEQKTLEVEAKADTLRKTLDINADLLKETKSLNDLLALRIDTITIQKRELGEQFTIVQQQRNDIASANAALQVSNASLKDAFDTLEVKNKLTEAAKKEADVQRDLAMEARTRSEITSNQLQALFMAAQSLETPSKDSAKALAEMAYDLYTANGGSPYDSRIYTAMEKALDRISPQIQSRLECYPVIMDYSPSRDLAAVMGLDGTLWEVRNVNVKGAVSPSMTSSKGNQINVLEYVPEINGIIASNQSNALVVYDISGKSLRTISGHTEPVTSLKYLPGRKVLLSTTQSGDFRLTDGTWKSKTFPIVFPEPKNKITAIEVSPDEQYLVVGNNLTLTLYLWGEPASTLGSVSLQSPVAKMAFNRDATILAIGLENGEVWFYEWASKSLRPIMSHRSKVTAVGFSPDGKYFASGSFDQSLRLLRTYDLKSPPIALTGHGDWVTGLGFSADSKALYSISKDKTIRHWYTQPAELKDALHQVTP